MKKLIIRILTAILLMGTSIGTLSGQTEESVALEFGRSPTQPLQLQFFGEYHFSASDWSSGRYNDFVRVGVSMLNLKSQVSRHVNLSFGRGSSWEEDFLITVGYGRRYHLSREYNRLQLHLGVIGDAAFESYRATSTWVRHEHQNYVYQDARIVVYHLGATLATSIHFPISGRVKIKVTPFSLRGGIGYVSVPRVNGLAPVSQVFETDCNILCQISPIDRTTGWKSRFSLFNGPLLGISFAIH